MGTKDKLIQRFKRQPRDFTWQELVRLFALLGFEVSNKGRTSGSRVIFENGDMAYMAHNPHPERFIKAYVMKQVMDFLQNNGLL